MKIRKVGVILAALVVAVTQLAEAQPAAAYPTSQVQFVGHGWGHGRGLSQFGSYGYAKDKGWNHGQILDHYYGGTTMGNVGNPWIGVRLLGNDNKDLAVTSESQFSVGGRTFGANTAARIRRTGDKAFAVDEGPNCAGPWTQVATHSGQEVKAMAPNAELGTGNTDTTKMLKRCATDGIWTYRGDIAQVDDNAGQSRAVNSVRLEEYLMGVVPRESPASWGSSGGMEALKAQAVAARSYVMASSNYWYATTCDTEACQVYKGVAHNGVTHEDARTNTAIQATPGDVRKHGNGAVARTEFSSSSGGYTAGGTFPAVVDEGDAVSANPNHTWNSAINVSDIEAKYPTIGSLQRIAFNQRNGFGEWGGRVLSMSLVGTGGTVNTTGAAFRTTMGAAIKSDWFNINYQPSGGVGGYWLMASDGGMFTFGNAQFHGSMGGKPLNRPVVGIAPTPSNGGYWQVASDGGVFSFGNAQFHGSMGGKPLNAPVVAMTSTPSGNGYWQVASDGGIFSFGDAKFFGSMGGQRLNAPIVGMASTPTGNGYWLVASDGGIFAYGDAVFRGSMGGTPLRQPVVGMARTADGQGYWMVARDGGIFSFGNAVFQGSLPGSGIGDTASGMSPTPTGGGYLISTINGNVHPFGDAPYFGTMATNVGPFVGSITGIVRSLQ